MCNSANRSNSCEANHSRALQMVKAGYGFPLVGKRKNR